MALQKVPAQAAHFIIAGDFVYIVPGEGGGAPLKTR